MKYYDKDIYEKSKKIEMYVVIMCIFLVGFILGYCAINTKNIEQDNTIQNQIIVNKMGK